MAHHEHICDCEQSVSHSVEHQSEKCNNTVAVRVQTVQSNSVTQIITPTHCQYKVYFLCVAWACVLIYNWWLFQSSHQTTTEEQAAISPSPLSSSKCNIFHRCKSTCKSILCFTAFQNRFLMIVHLSFPPLRLHVSNFYWMKQTLVLTITTAVVKQHIVVMCGNMIYLLIIHWIF